MRRPSKAFSLSNITSLKTASTWVPSVPTNGSQSTSGSSRIWETPVACINATLDGLLQSNKSFSVSATLRHGDVTRQVAFDDCYMEDKSFGLGAEGHAETVYSFTATRVREE